MPAPHLGMDVHEIASLASPNANTHHQIDNTNTTAPVDSGAPTIPGLPPIPAKLVLQIEANQFIEMSKLLPESLTLIYDNILSVKASKRNCKSVTSLAKWLQCFGLYIAVASCKHLQ